MATVATNPKQEAHELIDRMSVGQVIAAVGLFKAMLDPVEIALEGDRELTHCSNFVGDTYRVPLSFPPAKRAPKGLLRLHYNGSSPYLLTCRTSSPKMTRRMLRLSSKDAEAKETKAIAAEAVSNRDREASVAAQASQEGTLRTLRKQRDVANLPLAEQALQRATEALQLLPVPGQIVTESDLAQANAQIGDLTKQLASIQSEIDEARGALKQTGSAVARERLADAEEALRIAEQREKETEEEYEAWKLLLEQMKEAAASQASSLGLALSPAVADRFADLTLRRYGNVELSAGLATKGIVAGGSVRSTDLLSVGTRDQLSTLLRLALAEYPQTRWCSMTNWYRATRCGCSGFARCFMKKPVSSRSSCLPAGGLFSSRRAGSR